MRPVLGSTSIWGCAKLLIYELSTVYCALASCLHPHRIDRERDREREMGRAIVNTFDKFSFHSFSIRLPVPFVSDPSPWPWQASSGNYSRLASCVVMSTFSPNRTIDWSTIDDRWPTPCTSVLSSLSRPISGALFYAINAMTWSFLFPDLSSPSPPFFDGARLKLATRRSQRSLLIISVLIKSTVWKLSTASLFGQWLNN